MHSHEKHFAFLRLLVHGLVKIGINTTKVGVVLPSSMYDSPAVVLNMALNEPSMVQDLEIGEDGIRATLSFSAKPFYCHLPWYSVFQIVSDETKQAYVWEYDVPRPQAPPDELPSTGSDDAAPRHVHRDAHIAELKPRAPKPKRALPPGWGGIVKDNTPQDKEPA